MPFHVVRQYAQKQVPAHVALAADRDRSHFQEARLQRAERPLDLRQALAGLDSLMRPQRALCQAGEDDAYAVPLRPGVDAPLPPRLAVLSSATSISKCSATFLRLTSRPASGIADRPKPSRTLATWAATVVRSAVLPGTSYTATG